MRYNKTIVIKTIYCLYNLDKFQIIVMFIGERINKLLEERKITKVNLYTSVGISGPGLDKMIAGANVRVGSLEKIADFFNVSMDYFFDREIDNSSINIGHHVNGMGNSVSGDITLSDCQKELAHLKQLLEEKERTIQILLKQQRV